GRRHAEGRLAATRAEMARLRARLDAVPSLSLEELRALAPAVPARARRRSDAEADAERLPFREFRSVAGEVIWVGRSAADNDALTFRHARGGDTWLHARAAPGAHVVVPARGGRPPAAETLLDAATLAAHYSPLAKEAQVDVHVAQVKNLRKPRSAPPGMVYASETKTIRVRMEAERVRRLLESSKTKLAMGVGRPAGSMVSTSCALARIDCERFGLVVRAPFAVGRFGFALRAARVFVAFAGFVFFDDIRSPSLYNRLGVDYTQTDEIHALWRSPDRSASRSSGASDFCR